MEQLLSFLLLIGLLMVILFIIQSPLLFLATFFTGAGWVAVRGSKKGWTWPNRP